MITPATRIAYAQVDNFLSLLDEKYVEMIPRHIRYFFKQEKDLNYNTPIVPDIPIKNQNLSTEALALIAYLNLNYWCKDPEEKKKLREIYKKNDQEYHKEVVKNQHGMDENSWKQREIENLQSGTEEIKNQIENQMIPYTKDPFFKKIWLKIKGKFQK